MSRPGSLAKPKALSRSRDPHSGKTVPKIPRLAGSLDLMTFCQITLIFSLLGVLTCKSAAEDQNAVKSSSAPNWNALANGLVQLEFDQRSGRFQAYGLRGEMMRLFEAGPEWQINDKKLGALNATEVVAREEDFEDKIGRGKKLIVEYQFNEAPSFRYELNVYEGKPWISATAFLPRGDYRLSDFSLVRGKVRVPQAFTTRVYYNVGTAGFNAGVWPMGISRWNSSALSVLYQAEVEDAIEFGFYSFSRASTSVSSQYLAGNEIGIDAAAHYYGYRPQEGELKSESLLLNFGNDPLAMLEQWADVTVKVVQPQFDHDTHTGRVNEWYTYGDATTEENILTMARQLRDSILPGS